MPIKVIIIAGTRPEFIKLAPLIKLMEKDQEFTLLFIDSGQHYDYNLNKKIMNDLELTSPKININVGSGTHGYQIGMMIIEIEKILKKHNPDIVIAQGDTNTVIATALATRKINKCFMHLEAGIRSFDKRMPEEVNRILTGECSMYHLAPTERAALNLLFEGIDRKSIFIVGNTIVDAVLQTKEIAHSKSKIFDELNIKNEHPLVLITLHRPANVDNKNNLELFVNTLINLTDFQFIFPIHPRTKNNLKKFNLLRKIEKAENIIHTNPLGYLDFSYLFSKSFCVLTDSGGIQEEASILKVPCITLRNNTERPETIEYGSNILVGRDMKKLKSELYHIKSDPNYLKGSDDKNPFGNGKAASKIVELIKQLKINDLLNYKDSKLWKGIPIKTLSTVNEQDNQLSVKEYEDKYFSEIQIIFDKKGNAHFPYDNRFLKKDEKLLINSFFSEKSS